MANQYFIEAFLMGATVSAIFGPIAMLFVQKTLKIGVKGAIAVGLGAALAKVVYGLVASAGFNTITHFLMGKIVIIKILGGSFLLYLGGKEYFQPPVDPHIAEGASTKNVGRLCAQTFLLALTNPITILFFISVFASMSSKEISLTESLLMAFGVFLGSVMWWGVLGVIVLIVRTRLSVLWLNRIRYFSAFILGGFGLWTLYSAFTSMG
jgi:putative LysE/RhtB family amino acid efflux pump